MITIKLTSRFTLSVIILKKEADRVQKMLDTNNLKYSRWQQHPMDGFIELRCDVNLRQAEIIRQLMKNIKVYD